MENKQTTTLHGVLLKISNLGILLIGKSGTGKSECALELISRNHQLIADDSVLVTKTQNNEVVGKCQQYLPYHMHFRGIGIIDISKIFGHHHTCSQHKIDLVIEFIEDSSALNYDLLGIDDQFYDILGTKVKHIQLTASAQKNLATLIEVAVKNELLKKSGENSALIFHNKLNEKIMIKQK